MYSLKYVQQFPLSIEKCWDFFSSPVNLKILTPDHLGFDITTTETRQMYAGQIIGYKIRPLWNISIEWFSEITHVQAPNYFIDEQRFGPYKFWHHEHRFVPISEGTEMTDLIYYKLPYGPVGKIFHFLKVKQELDAIFSYRSAKLKNMFGTFK